MLYAAVGLAVMFGALVFAGSQSIRQATELIYQERLTRAYTIAGIFQSDFRHVARDVAEEEPSLLGPDPRGYDASLQALQQDLGTVDPFRFFNVTGLWLVDESGAVLATAGRPSPEELGDTGPLLQGAASLASGDFTLATAPSAVVDRDAFAALITRVGHRSSPESKIVVVHLEADNSSAAYVPDSEGRIDPAAALADPSARYHLEIVGPDGRVALGIGEDETPGGFSYHFPVIEGLRSQEQAITLRHDPGPGESFEPHVMAVVPISASHFYLVLEQAVDVALALPHQLEQQLILLSTLGFLVTLAVAWVTTGRVVKPTQQLTVAAQRMAQGDLEHPVSVTADDEVGILAESLESMRGQLRSAYQQLEDTNKTLESQVRDRTARLGELLRQIISAQEEERARLARELHDETAQTLGALSIAVDRARDAIDGTSPQAAEHLAEARAIAGRLLEETRRLILDLRPLALDDLGLASAIRWYAETHLGEAGVEATVVVDQPRRRLPQHLEVALFRVAQEAVNNIAKHADAHHARIRLAFAEGTATVTVSDDGRGFEPDRVLGVGVPTRSVGLLGMQERVRLLDGRLQVRSTPSKGTTLTARIPIPEERT